MPKEIKSNAISNKILLEFIVERKFRIYRHLILGVVLIAGFYTKEEIYSEPVNSLSKILMFLVSLSLFYINIYFLVPAFVFKDKYVQYCTWIIMIFTVIALIVLILKGYLATYMILDDKSIHEGTNVLGLMVYFIFMAASTAVKLFQRWTADTQRIIELETITIKTELVQLKSQINPHFLFNMLNNVNVLIRKDQEKASRVLLKLSALLRYQLHDSARDQVLLTSEIKFIEDFLDLEKVRRDDFEVNITTTGDLEGVLIDPLLFIIFVENAVKHNDDAEKRSFVKLSFAVANGQLTFLCLNSKPTRPDVKDKLGGLGLNNIKRRLDLLYPGKHQLIIQGDQYSFSVNLKISL